MTKPKSACHCTNHYGTQKLQHKGKRAALNEAMKMARRHRGFQFKIYPCSAQQGVWHLTTKGQKK